MPTDDLPDGTYFRVIEDGDEIDDGYAVDEVVVEGDDRIVYDAIATLDTFYLAEILMTALAGPRDAYELGVWYPAAGADPAPRPDQPPLPGVAWAGDGDYED